MKQTIGFGLHLPIIKFKGEADHSREKILSFAKKAEYLDYDYLGVNDHIVFRLGPVTMLPGVLNSATTLRLSRFVFSYTPFRMCHAHVI
jgi:hypothetical protein